MSGARHSRSPRGGIPTKKGQALSKQQRILAQRDREGRRVAALEAARAEQERLDRRIAAEALSPVLGRVAGADYTPVITLMEPPTPIAPPEPIRPPGLPGRTPLPPRDAEGTWPRGEARAMLRQGYHIDRVQVVTGWGRGHLDDLPLTEDGYGLSTQEWIAHMELQSVKAAKTG